MKKQKLLLMRFYLSFHSETKRDKGIILSAYNCAGIRGNENLNRLKNEGITKSGPDIIWIINGRTILVRLFSGTSVRLKRHEKFDEKMTKEGLTVYNIPASQFDYFIKTKIAECSKEKN